jgi:hypothetical protein
MVLLERLDAIDGEVLRHQSALTALAKERDEITGAVRVLQRYGVPVMEAPAVRVSMNEKRPANLPEMILAVVDAWSFVDGPNNSEILRTIQERWLPEAKPDNVRPTIWRMVKDGRLIKSRDRYQRAKEIEATDASSVGDTSAASDQEPGAQGREAGPGGGT